jgi:hypothetical protein
MRFKIRISPYSVDVPPLDWLEVSSTIGNDYYFRPLPSYFGNLGLHGTIHRDGNMHIRKDKEITTPDLQAVDFAKDIAIKSSQMFKKYDPNRESGSGIISVLKIKEWRSQIMSNQFLRTYNDSSQNKNCKILEMNGQMIRDFVANRPIIESKNIGHSINNLIQDHYISDGDISLIQDFDNGLTSFHFPAHGKQFASVVDLADKDYLYSLPGSILVDPLKALFPKLMPYLSSQPLTDILKYFYP